MTTPTTHTAHSPRLAATSLLPPGYGARVLEPSPPANTDPVWFADDPTDPTDAAGEVVTPVPGDGTSWGELAAVSDPVADFARDHWLDGRRRLRPLPDSYAGTRRALHQLAFFALAPARHAATGKLGLRYTHRGFGTPFYGADEQVRVEGDRLVHHVGPDIRSHRIATVRSAVEFLGLDYRESWFDGFHDPLEPVGPDTPLDVDVAAADALGGWFGFATHVLERFRRMPGAENVTRVQLWPEHFDPAIEMGSRERDRRASYGASPGDDADPQPYLFVAPWGDIDEADPFWNATDFAGARLSYRRLIGAEDPYATALAFFAAGHRRLDG